MLGGKVYRLPGEIDIDSVIEGVKLSGELRASVDVSEEAQVESLERLRAIVVEQMRIADPDVEIPRLTFTALDYIFGLMMGEIGERAEEAALKTITGNANGEVAGEGPPTRPKARKARPKASAGQRRKR